MKNLEKQGSSMQNIRPTGHKDLERIAEIEVFNYRLNFYPIFQNDGFYFDELTVSRLAEKYREETGFYVYDDGVVKGFVQVSEREIKKLFVEPVLQGKTIGKKLLDHAVSALNAGFLWVLEKNTRAISFYERSGFHLTKDKKFEEGTTESLVRMEL